MRYIILSHFPITLILLLAPFALGNAISLAPETPVQITPLIKCLGQEELNYHLERNIGPHYKLNQFFINSMAGANDLKLRTGYLEKICPPNSIPSRNLLKELLLNGLSIFNFAHGEENFREKARQLTVMGHIEERLPHLFFHYISSLQALSEDPHCLKREIPEVSYFTEKVFYLEEEVPRERLLQEKRKLRRLFNKLDHINSIYKKCKKRKPKKS